MTILYTVYVNEGDGLTSVGKFTCRDEALDCMNSYEDFCDFVAMKEEIA